MRRGTSLITVLFVAALVTIGFVCNGCGYKSIKHGEEITSEQVSMIVDGKTTKKDMFVNFGDPTKTMDNEKVFFYTWTRGGKGSFLGFGSGSAESKSLVVVFDEKGVVESHRITRGATAGGAAIGD